MKGVIIEITTSWGLIPINIYPNGRIELFDRFDHCEPCWMMTTNWLKGW